MSIFFFFAEFYRSDINLRHVSFSYERQTKKINNYIFSPSFYAYITVFYITTPKNTSGLQLPNFYDIKSIFSQPPPKEATKIPFMSLSCYP